MSEYKFGEKIRVRSGLMDCYTERIFVCDGYKGGVRCVIDKDENAFLDGDSFVTLYWKYHEPIPAKTKRLMTPLELIGAWVRNSSYRARISLVTAITANKIRICDTFEAVDCFQEYTRTPEDESSWKPVEVEE